MMAKQFYSFEMCNGYIQSYPLGTKSFEDVMRRRVVNTTKLSKEEREHFMGTLAVVGIQNPFMDFYASDIYILYGTVGDEPDHG